MPLKSTQSLMDALTMHCAAPGESVRHFVSLSDALNLDHSILFQDSTTGALVQGVYNKAVTVGGLKNDFRDFVICSVAGARAALLWDRHSPT